MNEQPLFVESIHFTNIKCDLDLLEKQALEHAEVQDGRSASNVGGYQSKDDPKISNEFDELLSNICKIATEELQSFYQFQAPLRCNNWWLNINDNGDSNQVHHHGDSLISGCFYVVVPKIGGMIHFDRFDARAIWHTSNVKHLILPEQDVYHKTFLATSYNTVERGWQPEAGQVCFWPGYMTHGVYPHYDDMARITVAFNLIPTSRLE